jgi:release factor glutamine methyltransferase
MCNTQNLRQIKQFLQVGLENIYETREAESIIEIMLEHVLGMNKTQIFLNSDEIIDSNRFSQLKQILSELLSNKPIQYIIGETEFYGRVFKLNQEVLIPRQETEELVHAVIHHYGTNPQIKILDIGTGSGVISISLSLEMPDADVFATDISIKALDVAKQNNEMLKSNVRLFHHDVFSDCGILPDNLDCIVSNPPYVRVSEQKEMKDNVLKFEPQSALFVPDEDALKYYDRIAKIGKEKLKLGGRVFCEINQYLGNETMSCFRDSGYSHVELIKDINHNNRIITAIK